MPAWHTLFFLSKDSLLIEPQLLSIGENHISIQSLTGTENKSELSVEEICQA